MQLGNVHKAQNFRHDRFLFSDCLKKVCLVRIRVLGTQYVLLTTTASDRNVFRSDTCLTIIVKTLAGTHVGHVKCPLLSPNFNQNWNVSTHSAGNFKKIGYVGLQLLCAERQDKLTGITKLIDTII